MREPKRISAFWLGIAAVIIILLAIQARAGDDCRDCVDIDITGGDVVGGDLVGGDTTVTSSLVGGTVNGGDNTMGGSRNISLGSTDVDINDGIYSWSILGGLVQGVKLNRWEAALEMDSIGLHDAAARMRCTIKPVLKLYDNKAQCIDSQKMVQVFHAEPQPAMIEEEEDEHSNDVHTDDINQLYALVSDLQTQRTQEAQRAEKAAQRANLAAREAERLESERREYAQQTLEELKAWK